MAKQKQIINRLENVSFGILLDNPKNSFNIGASIRSMGAFSGNFLGASQNRFKDKGDWRTMDTECVHTRVPIFLGVADLASLIPEKHVPIAIELSDDAVSLHDFQHPPQAVYFFGPEDGSLDQKYINICTHKVFIPTHYSLNLGQAVNTVCYDRNSKLSLRKDPTIRCPACQHNYYTTDGASFKCNACGNVWATPHP